MPVLVFRVFLWYIEKAQLANELADVIHYAFAIAALNEINLNDVILEKDKKASIKYNHRQNLEEFLRER